MAETCILYLSCSASGILLAVLLGLFLTCLLIFCIERHQRARFPNLPDGRWEDEPVVTKVLSESIVQEASAMAQTPGQKITGGEHVKTLVPQRLASLDSGQNGVLSPEEVRVRDYELARRSIQKLQAPQTSSQPAPSTTFSSRAFPSRPPLAPTNDEGKPICIGMEVFVVAVDETRGWCGRLGGIRGSRQAWFSEADLESALKLEPGDVVTVVGLRLNSWCGACRGISANYTLPADGIARTEWGFPGSSFASLSPYSSQR